MSDAKKKAPPDEELLEFLGDIDEANDGNADDDFPRFLAEHDLHELANTPPKTEPPKSGKVPAHE